ncbi:hypothetical protein BV898_16874 [Hypsibius exemplaris]|uniref:Uncharacterized protein n=1 Tax=Hypsibius exemplaris TaxID=2072580 RepID=A0A9X6RM20_HYPEX|nr:hypothetical protein BV898_16874 [Hypsibius exemplaris]
MVWRIASFVLQEVMLNQRKTVAALDRIAKLHNLYDATTDSFTGIFSPRDTLTAGVDLTDNPFTDTKFNAED